ncbi:S1/P1 nuclease [Lipomyces orientalis]|uniref:S1/P1 nuclease n=1 Tax=Lipomyces orientalis TaxID=1233043 RepID=A0ACC3TLQ3_9ASCO
MRHFLLFFALLHFCCILQPISGWGDVGHRTVAYLAAKYLTEEGSQLVKDLLSNDEGYDISDAATWADTVKQKRPYTRPWHYIDALDNPPDSCDVAYEADCSDKGCIVSAIQNMTHRVNDDSVDDTQRKEALMFLIHFLGDVHQPLHVEGTARGGNAIKVCFDSRCAQENLHSIWDTDIPHKINGLKHSLKHNDEKDAAAEWAERLYTDNQKRTLIAECSEILKPLKCAMQWVKETNRLNCEFVFKNGIPWLERNNLGEEYYEGAAPIVSEQIYKAAVRLAIWINALAAERISRSRNSFVVQG